MSKKRKRLMMSDRQVNVGTLIMVLIIAALAAISAKCNGG